jgi:hypothetical protein
VTRFQEWKITTKAVLAASAVAAVVAVAVSNGGGTVTVHNASSDASIAETTTSTEVPTTTTTTAAPTTTTSAVTATTVTTGAPPAAVVTTTTTAPARTVDVSLGTIVNDATGSRVPVTVTVTNGTADITVCLTSTILEQGAPFGGGLAFYDVSGTQTLDWSYQYAGQHITDVRIVKHLVDSRYGCMAG